MTALPPDCEAVVHQLDALRRGELDAGERASLLKHLAACRHCLCVERFERAFLERLREAGQKSICPEELRARVEALCAEGTHDA